MPGETDVRRLLAELRPELEPGEYVYVSAPDALIGDLDGIEVFATIYEEDGQTLVLRREDVEHAGLRYDARFRRITLRVYSSLQAVGLTAAVATALAEAGIAANVIAGYYHDYVFVPADRGEEAQRVLLALSAENREG